MMNKINTFTDFIDVTDALQEQAIIDPKRTYARGGSAGGLLMGSGAEYGAAVSRRDCTRCPLLT